MQGNFTTAGLCMQPDIAVSAKAATRMVSWLHLEEDEYAEVAFEAVLQVDPPLAESWQHLVMVLCKSQQASKALSALQQLSYMSALPSTAVAEVCKALVNLAGGFSVGVCSASKCCCHHQACLD